MIWVSSQWYVGRRRQPERQALDYWVANLHGSYQLTKELQIYGVINNLFNRKFATFGTYFDVGSIVNVLPNPADRPPHHHRRSRSRSMLCARGSCETVLRRRPGRQQRERFCPMPDFVLFFHV